MSFPTYTHWARAWAKTNPAYISQQRERTQAGGPVPLFLTSFSTKISCVEKVHLEKVQRQLAIHTGPTQFPQNWQAPGFMLIFRIMRASCFTFKFLLIHQRINMDAGHNADDIIITKILVAQAHFSGFLIVKTVLDHILGREGDQLTLHPLVRIVRVHNEVENFKLALKGLARHGAYSFAWILTVSGVNNLEHDLLPQLPAIALGVTTAHRSTLAGVAIAEEYTNSFGRQLVRQNDACKTIWKSRK